MDGERRLSIKTMQDECDKWKNVFALAAWRIR
jgi:hypothetical protein